MQHFLVFFTLKVNLQRERRKTSFAFLSLYESHSRREAETREERVTCEKSPQLGIKPRMLLRGKAH